jgi:hypothetical protein
MQSVTKFRSSITPLLKRKKYKKSLKSKIRKHQNRKRREDKRTNPLIPSKFDQSLAAHLAMFDMLNFSLCGKQKLEWVNAYVASTAT